MAIQVKRTLLTTAIGLAFVLNSVADATAPARVAVLIELAGGNDGLNTVVPYTDVLYRELRPNLALPADSLVPLGSRAPGLALHPSLAPIIDSWNAGDMAVILGVGYADQNRSHFRSLDIWETASDSKELKTVGWLTSAQLPGAFLADGVVLGEPRPGPLRGGTRTLALRDVASFLKQAKAVEPSPGGSGNDSRLWASATAVVQGAAQFLMAPSPSTATIFPDTDLGRQFATAAELIRRGFPTPVYKLTLRGFDTHASESAEHARLLAQLASGLMAFRADLKASGHWDRVLVATYSEFGRRVAENESGGFDHGAASVLFLWGGSLRGGLMGSYPPLDRLLNGDLPFLIDYRRVWATVLAHLDPSRTTSNAALFTRSYEPLSLLH